MQDEIYTKKTSKFYAEAILVCNLMHRKWSVFRCKETIA